MKIIEKYLNSIKNHTGLRGTCNQSGRTEKSALESWH